MNRPFRVHQAPIRRGREWGGWRGCHDREIIHVGFQVRFHLKKGFNGKTKTTKTKPSKVES